MTARLLGTLTATLFLGCLLPSPPSEDPARSPEASPPSAPPAHTEPPADASTLGLPPEEVRQTILRNGAAFARCGDKATTSNPQGGVRIFAVIAPDGNVTEAALLESTLDAPGVAECMLATFRSLKFPAADRPTRVSFPFAFR